MRSYLETMLEIILRNSLFGRSLMFPQLKMALSHENVKTILIAQDVLNIVIP